MKIHINVDESIPDLEVQIHCNHLTPEIEKIISVLRIMDMQLSVKNKGETYLLDINKVLYVESVDRKTFVYTEDGVYESEFRLYELEEKLVTSNFIRISKSGLVNIKKIKSLKPDIERRIRITMVNGEQIVVSRMYAEELRKRIGIK